MDIALHMKRKEFARFYDKHFKRIYTFVYFRVGGHREKAEDYTQDIFLKALDAFDRYDPAISESAWIFTIARNHIINQAAKERPQTDLEAVENTIWDTEDWGANMEIAYDEKRLLAAIQMLPKDEADLIRLKYLEGWKFKDISELTDSTPGSLRVKAMRTLKKLKKALKQK
ncbi:RNA polymerase sigma factor [Candidatus Uhrbacteria bacterium UHB]|nr:RNA polymerase sigma factor [Candidatus Uhrbacteria bacterium UHB]RIL00339.1 MAG: hypothetical protein DCC77_02100 [Candidatus Uhrbacteria bacterium]